VAQEQIRVQPTRRPQQEENTQAIVYEATRVDDAAQSSAIDDAILDILGPSSPSEMIGSPREQRTVRRTTTSEEFVRNFRQHGGE
jgi:hypothetical protein